MKILITDNVHPLLIENLEKSGYDVAYLPQIEWDEVYDIIEDFCAIVINTKTVMNKKMLDKAKNLKLIVRLGSGLDIIDLEYAHKKNIIVERTPEGNRNAVAEHALGLLLAMLNNIVSSNIEVRNFQWNREKNRGIEIEGKTIGIIGFGNTGTSFAEKLKCFDLNILVYDKYKQRFQEQFRYVRETGMNRLFEECDIVSFHIPLTEETKYLVDKSFINKFRKDIYLINTSRGKIINTKDLVNELESGKIKGAALDVLENEKPWTYNEEEKIMYNKLFSMENVIVTP
ncbi:MAG TPA: hydroxyacid dehydrogenase, partial [Bacteroidetes bacterium]|nr:hydroxyacid dehydrogenase [Bacteroidota bacterium]